MTATLPLTEQIEQSGFALAAGVFSAQDVTHWQSELSEALGTPTEDGPLRNQAGSVYGSRNILRLWPEAANIWRRSPMLDLLTEVFSPVSDFGLVRVLFFDKPPGSSWALPWHKDLTIAVRDNTLSSHSFTKPTRKANVPHVEAPVEVLETMLTARIHLDEVNSENGPLKVVAGSHRTGKTMHLEEGAIHTILAQPGDVLLMRPLLAHSSGHCADGTTRYRRILHLEFAARRELPDGFDWHDYLPGSSPFFS